MTTARPLAAVLFATTLFLLPALWNGSVLYYWDSVDYVYLPFTWDLPAYRTMPYGVFTGIGRVTGTLWAVIAVQAGLTAYVLHEALSAFAVGKPARLLAVLAVPLAALTSLPWATSELMADALTGPVVLAMITLVLSGDRLSLVRRLGLAGVAVVGIAVHTSHLAVAAGLTLTLPVLAALTRRWGGEWADGLRARFVLPAAAVLAGIAAVAAIHWITVGRAFVTQPSAVLWVGRLVEDGIAKRLLDDVCVKGDEYKLCKWKDDLPPTANSFLWLYGGAPEQLYGSWEKMRPEAQRFLRESFKRYPGQHVLAAIKLSAEQLVRFHTGDGLVGEMDWLIKDTLARYYPRQDKEWKVSRQHTKPGIDFDAINAVHVPVEALGQILLIVLAVVAWRRRERIAFALATATVIALLGNAFVCGALSNPNDRYQARLAWVPLVVLAIGATRLRARRREETSDEKGAEPAGPAP